MGSKTTITVLSVVVLLVAAIAAYKAFKPEGKLELVLPASAGWIKGLKETIRVEVDSLPKGSRAPQTYTCDGQGLQPRIHWTSVKGAKAYTLIVYDPDAPIGFFYHLVKYNIRGLEAASPGQLLPNTAGTLGWYPICPPPGDKPHRYYFIVVAQDTLLPQTSDIHALLKQLKNHAIAYGWTLLTYKR